MGRLQVTITANGLEARLRVTPGPMAYIEDVQATLADAGITHGLDESAIAELAARLADPRARCAVAVAFGTAPIRGADGNLVGELVADRSPGTVDETGRIDYRERATIQPIRTEEFVAEIMDPTAGTPGWTVSGNMLRSEPGNRHAERIGDGLRQSGNRLFAKRDGAVLHTHDLLDVVPLYTHSGDVDFRSGNLRTNGSLRIEGDVNAGFTVNADGDVEIRGTVEDASVTAQGSVLVGAGILGNTHSIRAGKDIVCHHATAAKLIAGGTITIEKDAVQTTARGEKVFAIGPHGVRGGALYGRECVAAEVLGCQAGSTTRIVVGEAPGQDARAAREHLKTARATRVAIRNGRHDATLAKRSGKATRNLTNALDSERATQRRLERRRREQLATAWVRVSKTCYPGTVIRFGDAELRPETALGPSIFRYDSDRNEVVRETLQ
ncbi:MAG: FapA family protein [bacterium]|nr:FapA family protein [bacterium]